MKLDGTKALHWGIFYGFLLLLVCGFNCSCRSVKKTQHSEVVSVIDTTKAVSTYDSSAIKNASTLNKWTAKSTTAKAVDTSKTRETTTTYEKPVFDTLGRIKSADRVVIAGVIKEAYTSNITASNEHSILVHENVDAVITVSKTDSTAKGESTTSTVLDNGTNRTTGSSWLWWLLLLIPAGLVYWQWPRIKTIIG